MVEGKAASACPHLYAVCASKPFVDVLACHLLDEYGQGPLGLSEMLLLVPNRRSVGAVRQALLQHAGGKPLLLPRIQPLRDADLDRIMPELLYGPNADPALAAARAIPAQRRTLELSRLIGARGMPGEENFSTDQNIRLAEALGELIDDMAREEIDFARFAGLVPADYAAHWQITLDFLQVVARTWPERRKALGGMDGVERQSLVLGALAAYWEANPPAYPVVAAGTTGSIPATARLLATIAGLPTGRVILSGLDREMAGEDWERIEPSHPQAGLKRLLHDLVCSPSQVRPLDSPRITGAPASRMRLLAEAMLPAESSGRWRESRYDLSALDGFGMVAFDDGDDEACGISLMLRDALEDKGKRVMLVTHDRALARQVAIRLKRFGIDAEDGGGRPLAETRAASFVLALIDASAPDAGPVALLGLLKHPLCGLSLSRDVRLNAVGRIEKAHLRGIRPHRGVASLLEAVKAGEADVPSSELIERLHETLSPLSALREKRTFPLTQMLDALIAAAERISRLPEEGEEVLVWQHGDGKALHRFLSTLRTHADALGDIPPGSLAGILRGLMAKETYHPPHEGQPRLLIVSPVEARMQHADRVILAGLNEESWPPAPKTDPWMSRAMRVSAGLAPHEMRIGLSAHDFFTLAAAPEVILTRAVKTGSTPRRASRWWLRLEALLDASKLRDTKGWRARGEQWRGWTIQAEQPVGSDRTAAATRPEPCPDLSVRPAKISVSEVERLLNDPYLYHARAILRLEELEPIDKLPDIADFGSAVHDALKRFMADGLPLLDAASGKRLEELLAGALAEVLHRDELPVFWRQRIGAIAAEIMRGEAERRGLIDGIEVEKSLSMTFGSDAPFTLHGRLDRIDRRKDGAVELIDYKTAGSPTQKDVESGRKPQLPLCGLLAEADRREVSDLHYWTLKRSDSGVVRATNDPGQAMLGAREGMDALIAHRCRPESTYPSRADETARLVADAYDHLSRTEEWQ